jgi:hypothetical protein
VFAIGELGETIAVAAHRRLVRAAAAQLAD